MLSLLSKARGIFIICDQSFMAYVNGTPANQMSNGHFSTCPNASFWTREGSLTPATVVLVVVVLVLVVTVFETSTKGTTDPEGGAIW